MKTGLQLQLLLASTLLLLLCFPPYADGDLNTEKKALLDFAAAFPRSRHKLNWASANFICFSWVGITCNKNGSHVLAVRLPAIGLRGPIPANTLGKLNNLITLSLRSNSLNGQLPSDILSLPSLLNLYLQQNGFSGTIPSSFSPQITMLDLSFNSFSGSIPSTIQNLQNLTSLSLQNNSLTGSIPALNTAMLGQLNLSYNQLNGSIPSALKKYPASSFQGNPMLCGPPLTQCSTPSPSPSPTFFPVTLSPPRTSQPPTTTPSPSPSSILPPMAPPASPGGSKKGLSKGSMIAIVASGSSAALLLLLAILGYCIFRKRNGKRHAAASMLKVKGSRNETKKEDFGSGVQATEKNKLVFLGSSSYNFDLEDLLKASAEVLGKGSYGTTYKAVLEEGTTVVVKRLKELIIGKKEFELQMESLGRVGQHPNVAPICAYYYSKDEKLLVYDYVPAGNFGTLLHGCKETGRSPPDWESRLKISMGVARGINHIHSAGGGGGGKLVHGNIKSSNILITQDLDARVSDFGLSPLMSHLLNNNGSARTSKGYQAPEVIETRKPSQEADVYSFGVVLMEMLTGKEAVQGGQGGQLNEVVDLPRWVQSVVHEEWTAEVFDVELMKYQDIEEEMVRMLQIAMACVAIMPDMRPTMRDVVKMIEEIWSSYSEKRVADAHTY